MEEIKRKVSEFESNRFYYFHGKTVLFQDTDEGITIPEQRFTVTAMNVDSTEGTFVAISLCSINDNFSKKVGREISEQRLNGGNRIEIKYRFDTVDEFVDYCNYLCGLNSFEIRIEFNIELHPIQELIFYIINDDIDICEDCDTPDECDECYRYHEMNTDFELN